MFRTVDNLGRILTRVKTQSPLKRDKVSYTRLNVSTEICGRDEKKIDNCENLAFDRFAVAEHAWHENHEINFVRLLIKITVRIRYVYGTMYRILCIV